MKWLEEDHFVPGRAEGPQGAGEALVQVRSDRWRGQFEGFRNQTRLTVLPRKYISCFPATPKRVPSPLTWQEETDFSGTLGCHVGGRLFNATRKDVLPTAPQKSAERLRGTEHHREVLLRIGGEPGVEASVVLLQRLPQQGQALTRRSTRLKSEKENRKRNRLRSDRRWVLGVEGFGRRQKQLTS